ncbi:MAG: SDR family oxidoreductase, partial [Spirochaetota bacterium]|nr:SDR family oxidoreductase [Spirochaetota bacterium]
ERRIRVNTLSPGPIDTPIFHRAGVPEEAVEGMKDQFTQMVPMKRLGTSREIGTAAVFLASQDSSYVVGEELQVDGGMANL